MGGTRPDTLLLLGRLSGIARLLRRFYVRRDPLQGGGEEALQEWARTEILEEVRIAWGRLGYRVTLHRYGRGHFAELACRRRRARSENLARKQP